MLPNKKIAYIVDKSSMGENIAQEILSHREAGLDIIVVSTNPLITQLFDLKQKHVLPISVITLMSPLQTASEWWETLKTSSQTFPFLFSLLGLVQQYHAKEVLQGIQLTKILTEHQITHVHACSSGIAADITHIAALFTTTPYSFNANIADLIALNDRHSRSYQLLANAAFCLSASARNTHQIYHAVSCVPTVLYQLPPRLETKDQTKRLRQYFFARHHAIVTPLRKTVI